MKIYRIANNDRDPLIKRYTQYTRLKGPPDEYGEYEAVTEDGEEEVIYMTPDSYDEEVALEDLLYQEFKEESIVNLDEAPTPRRLMKEKAFSKALVDKTNEYLITSGALEASSSRFSPGVWYEYTEEMDQNGTSTRESFHLKDYTPEEEEQIFNHIENHNIRRVEF